jgi:cytochrome c oxidase subunit 2
MRPRGAFLVLSLLLLALAASGCELELPQSTLNPAGDVAVNQKNLFLFVFWISVAIFIVVIGGLVYILFRFRAKPGSENDIPAQTHGNTPIEIAWTLAPALIVIAVTVPTIRGIGGTYDPPSSLNDSPAMTVEVVGHQWWWEYKYLNAAGEIDFVTANEMHIPVDTVVRLDLRSADVIHSFSIPALAGTRDAIPGRDNRSWFIAREIGRFEGQCKEFCGLSHALMRTVVFAESQNDYATWADTQRSPAVAASPDVQPGLDVFLAKGCIGCHTIDGVPNAVGVVGPNLTHFGSRSTVAANILNKNGGENVAKWLRDPPGIKPGSIMPDLNLSEDEISKVTTYLESLG